MNKCYIDTNGPGASSKVYLHMFRVQHVSGLLNHVCK